MSPDGHTPRGSKWSSSASERANSRVFATPHIRGIQGHARLAHRRARSIPDVRRQPLRFRTPLGMEMRHALLMTDREPERDLAGRDDRPGPGTPIHTITFPGGGRFDAVIYDLLDEPSVCIVNAANGGLSHGGGVAAAILEAAGPEFDRECAALVRNHGRIPVGQAALTTAGRLRFEGVIHAVGPRLGDGDEGAKIVSALMSAFTLAHDRGWRSLSFPAISAGLFLVPPDACASAYVEAVRSFYERYPDSPLRRIRLCLFKGPVVDAVRARMQDAALVASGKAPAQ